MAFSDFSIKNLFPTPLVMASFPPDIRGPLNSQIAATVFEKARTSPGNHISNLGGWQSDDRITEWGGAGVEMVLAALKELIGQVTLHLEGYTYSRVNIGWRVSGWANINRKGQLNVPHVHPGAYWSAVYYVMADEREQVGGELELLDPRGVTPILYCPSLRFGIKGYTTAGMSELHKPKPGECVLFPSWLTHAVRPYLGEETRMSLAFNFSV